MDNFGAKVYRMSDGKVVVKQTKQNKNRYTVCLRNDFTHIQRVIVKSDDQAKCIGEAILDAFDGKI